MGYRIDRAAAIICSALAQGKVAPENFMPRYGGEEESETSFTSVLAGLKSTAKPKAKVVKHG